MRLYYYTRKKIIRLHINRVSYIRTAVYARVIGDVNLKRYPVDVWRFVIRHLTKISLHVQSSENIVLRIVPRRYSF